MSNIQDLLTTDTITIKKTRKKVSKEACLRMSLAARTRDLEVVRKNMQKLGKKPKRMTEKRLTNLRRQQETLATREDNRRGGLKTISKPENRRKIMRKWKGFVNLTDEQFEEKMKELDKKFEARFASEQSDITSKDSSKDNV